MKKILKRGMSGLLAVLMAFTVLAGFGTTTAFAASETAESYMISFPRDGDAAQIYSEDAWGHSAKNYMNGWATGSSNYTILTELKTNAAKRSIPLPPQLLEALKEAKESSTSDYVIANKDGQPLTYTQFKRLWTYITTRTAKPRRAKKLVGGKYVKYTIYPVLGEKARNNGKVVYSLDFEVTPHQLRHTYITNLIYASVDPKTVQYLAGHENSKITMDIYAKAKYNRPKDVAPMLEHVFYQWNEATTK